MESEETPDDWYFEFDRWSEYKGKFVKIHEVHSLARRVMCNRFADGRWRQASKKEVADLEELKIVVIKKDYRPRNRYAATVEVTEDV